MIPPILRRPHPAFIVLTALIALSFLLSSAAVARNDDRTAFSASFAPAAQEVQNSEPVAVGVEEVVKAVLPTVTTTLPTTTAMTAPKETTTQVKGESTTKKEEDIKEAKTMVTVTVSTRATTSSSNPSVSTQPANRPPQPSPHNDNNNNNPKQANSISFTKQHRPPAAAIPPPPLPSTSTSSLRLAPSHNPPPSRPLPNSRPNMRLGLHVPEEYKYFHEAGKSMALTHYDARFFRDALPYEEHRIALRNLIRSYLATTSKLGIETWLAHGTLLGWWWNGRIMPWDYDVDVQVSGATMGEMVRRGLNGSFWSYPDESEGTTVDKRTYLLDINPHWSQLERGKGLNVIDARWIDTQTGMFVDITVLMEREPKKMPGVWSCKNRHYYDPWKQLYPLRETVFEGVRALVPFAVEEVLVAEYGEKCLVATEWEGHRWDGELREWVKMKVIPSSTQTPPGAVETLAAEASKKPETLETPRVVPAEETRIKKPNNESNVEQTLSEDPAVPLDGLRPDKAFEK